MLALILAAVVCVAPGATEHINVNVGHVLPDGGTFIVDNKAIAAVSGTVPPGSARGTFAARGVREGTTIVRVSYYRTWSGGLPFPAVAKVIVSEPMTLSITPSETLVAESAPVTLTAATNQDPDEISWYEGETLLGIGTSVTLAMPKGVHRIRAEASNMCGTVTSEVEITSVAPRRRAARH